MFGSTLFHLNLNLNFKLIHSINSSNDKLFHLKISRYFVIEPNEFVVLKFESKDIFHTPAAHIDLRQRNKC